jgi:hypothetical protein
MPRYYFDINDGETFTRGHEGRDLPDFDEARQGLMRAIGAITRNIRPDGYRRDIVGLIRDKTGRSSSAARDHDGGSRAADGLAVHAATPCVTPPAGEWDHQVKHTPSASKSISMRTR